MTTLSEQEFRLACDDALAQAEQALLPLADREGFEVGMQDGVLELLFDEPTPTKFVVSPNGPARQVWVSAMAKGYKLSWVPEARTFALDDEALPDLLARLIAEFLRGRTA